jgi:hypothetical protein
VVCSGAACTIKKDKKRSKVLIINPFVYGTNPGGPPLQQLGCFGLTFSTSSILKSIFFISVLFSEKTF